MYGVKEGSIITCIPSKFDQVIPDGLEENKKYKVEYIIEDTSKHYETFVKVVGINKYYNTRCFKLTGTVK